MAKMATGYEPDGSVAPLYDLGWVGPAGQMYSTTTDLSTVRSSCLSHTLDSIWKDSQWVPLHPPIHTLHSAPSWPTSLPVLLERMEVSHSTLRFSLVTCGERWNYRVSARVMNEVADYVSVLAVLDSQCLWIEISWLDSVLLGRFVLKPITPFYVRGEMWMATLLCSPTFQTWSWVRS